MNQIKVSDIIKIDNVYDYKFHAARWNERDQPLDVYVRDPEEWFHWNTWCNTKNAFSRDYIFSLIDFYPETETWLFGGIYKVISRSDIPNDHSYEIEEIKEFSQYIGRMKIHLPKPSRGRAFYLENYYEKMLVSEILKEPYTGELFPGYDNICIDFHELQPIFLREKLDWKSALENVKGIYAILDKTNGKKYIGSAYGDFGVWSRWSCYIGTGHGWNDELTKLIKKKWI